MTLIVRPCGRQNGAALFISLVFLLLLTLLGVSAMESATLEEKMAGNSRSRSVAFQAAEAALRDAEWLIRRGAGGDEPSFIDRFDPACGEGLCAAAGFGGGFATRFYAAADWAGGTGLRLLGENFAGELNAAEQNDPALTTLVPDSLPGVALQPAYLIEATRGWPAGVSDPGYLYRITARGYGADNDNRAAPRSRVTLQEVYRPAR